MIKVQSILAMTLICFGLYSRLHIELKAFGLMFLLATPKPVRISMIYHMKNINTNSSFRIELRPTMSVLDTPSVRLICLNRPALLAKA